MIRYVTIPQILQRISRPDNKARFVEATSVASYERGRLPEAVLLPPDQVEKLAPKVLESRGVELIVYGESDGDPAAELTARKLHEMGYANILLYRGGKRDWIASGLETQALSMSLSYYPQLVNYVSQQTENYPDTATAESKELGERASRAGRAA
jgi:3-mercaptopyruvate sulfurtransferase SseA